jgi:hypothetical protein
VFASGESVGTVQCWLMRFFGPQAALQSMHRVTLTPALSVNERFLTPYVIFVNVGALSLTVASTLVSLKRGSY